MYPIVRRPLNLEILTKYVIPWISFFIYKVLEVLLTVKKVLHVHADEHKVPKTITRQSIRRSNRELEFKKWKYNE